MEVQPTKTVIPNDFVTIAQVVAEGVDAQRGHAMPPDVALLPGESQGTDLAESISCLMLRLDREVNGPRGRD